MKYIGVIQCKVLTNYDKEVGSFTYKSRAFENLTEVQRWIARRVKEIKDNTSSSTSGRKRVLIITKVIRIYGTTSNLEPMGIFLEKN